MSIPILDVNDWKSFEKYAQRFLSERWGIMLKEKQIMVAGLVPWKFDLVSVDANGTPDYRYVGDVKWLKNAQINGAKNQAIAEYIWLLQKVEAEKRFLVFGRDIEVAQRYLNRVRNLISLVEFY